MARKKCESKFVLAQEAPKPVTTSPFTTNVTPVNALGGQTVPGSAGEVSITITSNDEVIYPVPEPNDFGFNDFIFDFKKSHISFAKRVESPMYVYLFAIEMITKVSPNPAMLTILDIGCADGVFEYILERDFGVKAQGVEVSQAGRKEYLKNIGREASSSIDNIVGVADVVVAIETLEHVPDHVGLLNEMWKRTDKVLIFTVPREGALDSPDHKHIFNFYDIYELCENLNPKPLDFGIYQINKHDKFGNPLNVFGVVIWK